jgi:hypothetical protein
LELLLMRVIPLVIVATLLAVATSPAQAKTINQTQAEMCRWGSGVARDAQLSKLSGKTLYSTRKRVQERTYPRSWMKKMAVGITEQTFASRSRVKPDLVKQTYYQGCVRHEMAHR